MGVAGQVGIALEDVQVRFGQQHLDVVEHGGEERPVARHLRHRINAVFGHALLQRVAHAVPAGQAGAVLRPRKHPRDRAQVGDAALTAARRPRADLQPLDHVHRGRGAEVGVEPGIVVHQRAVRGARVGGQAAGHVAPAARARFLRPRAKARPQHRAGGLLQVAQGQRADAVLAVDHLALLGHPHPPVHGAARRGDDGALGLAAAAAHRAAAPMEEHQPHAGLPGQPHQVYLGPLQRPARSQQATVLGAVGIAQHHDLAITAGAHVAAVDGVVEQRTHHPGGGVQVVDRLEQRRHVQRHFAIALAFRAAGNARQRQHRQRVGGVAAHADDVGAEGIGAVALARRLHRAEDLQRGRRRFRIRHLRPRRFDQGVQPLQPLLQRPIAPVVVTLQRAKRGVVGRRVLAQVQRCHMEAEAARAPQQAPQRQATGMVAAVGRQAGLDQLQVGEEFIDGAVGVARVRIQPRRHQLQQLAVRHVLLPRAQRSGSLGHGVAVRGQAFLDITADTGAVAGLGQHPSQRPQLVAVLRQHLRALRGERRLDGVGAHVGIAIHVAAHPGAEAQHVGQFDALAPGRLHRIAEDLVERRQHPEQHAQVVANVVDLVGHRGPPRRRLGGLPGGGQRLADARLVAQPLLGRAGAVDVRHQPVHDHLLLGQQRTPDGLGRVGGEHRLHPRPGQQRLQLVQGHAIGVQRRQHRFQSARLGAVVAALVLAPAADAVHPLGQVDGPEPGRERPHQRVGVGRRHLCQFRGQRVRRLVVLAPRDRGPAHRLHLVQQRRRHLFGEHLAHHCTQAAHVVAQQGVGLGKFKRSTQRGAGIGGRRGWAHSPKATQAG